MHFVQLNEGRKGSLGGAEIILLQPNLNDKSELDQNGHWLSDACQRQLLSFSPTEGRNYTNMPNTSKVSFQPNTPVLTQRSCCTTKLEGCVLLTDYQQFTRLSEAILHADRVEYGGKGKTPQKGGKSDKGEPSKKDMLKVQYSGRMPIHEKMTATINTPVKLVEKLDMGSTPAQQKNFSEVTNVMRPKYLCYNIWDLDSYFTPNTSDWTLTAKPLKGPPQSAFDNEAVTKTLKEHLDLFKIVTLIQVDVFEAYLTTHPNQPFVKLVCDGLHNGFWPWATTPIPGYPTTNDESKLTPKDDKKVNFLRAQQDVELTKNHFSPPLKGHLLPGMYCMPIYAIPKPHSKNLHLVYRPELWQVLLNSMITHEKVTGFPLDNMVHFGEMLMDLERKEPGSEKVIWKSDIAEAYWILPMHPCWQIKQVN